MRPPEARRPAASVADSTAPLRPSAGGTPPREPDWPDAVAEYRTLLSDLIAIDTSNPPGRELEAARFLESFLAREGIPGRTFEAADAARMHGNDERMPVESLTTGLQFLYGVTAAVAGG